MYNNCPCNFQLSKVICHLEPKLIRNKGKVLATNASIYTQGDTRSDQLNLDTPEKHVAHKTDTNTYFDIILDTVGYVDTNSKDQVKDKALGSLKNEKYTFDKKQTNQDNTRAPMYADDTGSLGEHVDDDVKGFENVTRELVSIYIVPLNDKVDDEERNCEIRSRVSAWTSYGADHDRVETNASDDVEENEEEKYNSYDVAKEMKEDNRGDDSDDYENNEEKAKDKADEDEKEVKGKDQENHKIDYDTEEEKESYKHFAEMEEKERESKKDMEEETELVLSRGDYKGLSVKKAIGHVDAVRGEDKASNEHVFEPEPSNQTKPNVSSDSALGKQHFEETLKFASPWTTDHYQQRTSECSIYQRKQDEVLEKDTIQVKTKKRNKGIQTSIAGADSVRLARKRRPQLSYNNTSRSHSAPTFRRRSVTSISTKVHGISSECTTTRTGELKDPKDSKSTHKSKVQGARNKPNDTKDNMINHKSKLTAENNSNTLMKGKLLRMDTVYRMEDQDTKSLKIRLANKGLRAEHKHGWEGRDKSNSLPILSHRSNSLPILSQPGNTHIVNFNSSL